MVEKIAEYRKAIAAFIVPALVVLGASLADGVITAQEWIAVAIAALGTSVAVGAVPNALTRKQKENIGKHVVESGFDASSINL